MKKNILIAFVTFALMGASVMPAQNPCSPCGHKKSASRTQDVHLRFIGPNGPVDVQLQLEVEPVKVPVELQVAPLKVPVELQYQQPPAPPQVPPVASVAATQQQTAPYSDLVPFHNAQKVYVDTNLKTCTAWGPDHDCIKDRKMKTDELLAYCGQHGYGPESDCYRNAEAKRQADSQHGMAIEGAFIAAADWASFGLQLAQGPPIAEADSSSTSSSTSSASAAATAEMQRAAAMIAKRLAAESAAKNFGADLLQ